VCTLLGVLGAGVGVGAEYFLGGAIRDGDFNVLTGVCCSGVPLKIQKKETFITQ
jgi:hypothetical protein